VLGFSDDPGDRVTALQSRNDSFLFREEVEGRESFVIASRRELNATLVVEHGVFRSNGWIVEPC
jgi:hypothetical protein